MKTGSEAHRETAASLGVVKFAIITVSDTRTLETDANGHYLKTEIDKLGHSIVAYHLIKDEPDQVESALDADDTRTARIVILNGGTGISRRDRTFDVLEKKMEKTLPGFGEIFRMLSYEQVGAAAILSRAIAGIYDGRVIISTPGSPKAVQLAWEKLIAPEIKHFAWELTR